MHVPPFDIRWKRVPMYFIWHWRKKNQDKEILYKEEEIVEQLEDGREWGDSLWRMLKYQLSCWKHL